MTQFYTFLGEELIHALGWTFVHSLWQGSLIALIMTLVLSRIPTQQSQKRYLVATISLATVLLCALITFAILYQQPQEVVAGTDQWTTLTAIEAPAPSTSLHSWIAQFNPVLVSIWITGVLFFALRFCFGLGYLRHLKTSAETPTNEWQNALDTMVRTLGYPRKVKLAESALLRIPVVVGYLKPVILFPIGIVNQLQANEVEAILAHEVAHLMRNDFVHNLVQSLIEMVFYYHPAVWWISAVVRSERENCCDDLAIQVCNNSLTYAKALVRLEDISYSAPPALALPFAGSKGHLLNRIKRILNQPQNKSHVMERIIATIILIGCVTLLSFSERQTQSQAEQEDTTSTISKEDYANTDTVPAQREITVWKSVEGKEIEMRSQNGEIKSLKVNGEEIDPAEYDAYAADIEVLQAITEAPPVPPVPPVEPLPPFPPLPPLPAMPPMAPLPAMPPLPPMPAMPAMPPMPDIPDRVFFEDGLYTPGSMAENKTIIIRDKKGNGYSYRVESEGNTSVIIDSEKGIAMVNGEEVELDADSIFIIEQEERSGYRRARAPHFFGGNHGNMIFLRDSLPFFHYKIDREKMSDAEKAEWDAYERGMKEYGQQMEEWGKTWEGEWKNGDLKIYNQQMEEWGKNWEKQWKNEDWRAYEEQMKEFGDKWEKQHGEEWKVYGQQMEEYVRQLAELERENSGIRKEEARKHMEELELNQEALKHRIDAQQAQKLELEHALILQLDDEGNLVHARRLADGSQPFGPITRSMDREGLIDVDGEYSIILEADKLRVNGKKMSDDVHQKYLNLFERTQGYRLSGKSKIEISND